MNRAKLVMGSCFAVALALLAWGCSGTAGPATQLSPAKAEHQAGWIQIHWAEYVKTPDQCRTCHGSTSDPAAAGGISKVSCFTCHPKGINHPAGWADPAQHGRLGAQLAPSTDPTAMAGFAHCAKCHGSTYDNGLTTSCKSCHTKAPHPDRPWLGATLATPSHVNTNAANAPECFKCHANGANSVLKPATPAPAGTAPGCFNATLCHGRTVN